MTLKIFNANQKNSLKKLELIIEMRKYKQRDFSRDVKKILMNVKKNGDKAVLNYEKKFSKIKSTSKNIKFSKKEIDSLVKKIDKRLKYSIDIAYKRIKQFHLKQKFKSFKFKDKLSNELSYN